MLRENGRFTDLLNSWVTNVQCFKETYALRKFLFYGNSELSTFLPWRIYVLIKPKHSGHLTPDKTSVTIKSRAGDLYITNDVQGKQHLTPPLSVDRWRIDSTRHKNHNLSLTDLLSSSDNFLCTVIREIYRWYWANVL